MDRTKDLKTWNEGIKSKKLSSIADVRNQFLLPNVLYPWGLSELIYKVRYVDLDTAIQRFIQECKLSIVDVSKLSKTKHTRNDYLQESNNDYDMWLHNPDWKVLPKHSFVDGYPHVLTCKDHDGVCNLIQNHCCIWITNTPSTVCDKVCHTFC